MSYQIVGENLSGGPWVQDSLTTGLKSSASVKTYIVVVFSLPTYMSLCNLPLFRLPRSPTVGGRAWR